MPLYETDLKRLIPVPVTTFAAEEWKEREDIQGSLRDNISILEKGLLVLGEEFSGWSDSARRIDLLCLDKKAKLVVVELKRTEDGGHMELQALRYAAMVSQMTFDQAANILARNRDKTSPDIDAARAEILRHVGWAVLNESDFAAEVRIILASADFGRELTTAVIWLRKYKLDVKCVRLRPLRLGSGQLLIEVQPLIPLPEEADYQTKLQQKAEAERKERGERETLSGRFLDQLAQLASSQTEIHRGRSPKYDVRALIGLIGKSGFLISYVTSKDESRAELLISRDDARDCLLRLKRDQPAIEGEFGAPLEWREKEGVRSCRVYYSVDGGYGSPESEWPHIHQKLIDGMIKMDAAFRKRLLVIE